MCSPNSFSVPLWISSKNIFGLCPSFDLKPFERQQLLQIWPYMGFIIISPFVYNPIYSSSKSSCSKVHLNNDVIMYGSLWPQFLSMKSISISQCLTFICKAWSCLGARTISLPFNTQQITIMNVVFGNYGRLLLAFLLAPFPKSVAGRLLARLPFFLTSWIHLHFSPKASPPIAGESIQHYRNDPMAARSRMSPKDLPQPIPWVGVHQEPVSIGSAPELSTDGLSR